MAHYLLKKMAITKRWVEYCGKTCEADENDQEEEQQERRVCKDPMPLLKSKVKRRQRDVEEKQKLSHWHDKIHAEVIITGRNEAVNVYHALIEKKNLGNSTKAFRLTTPIYVPLPKRWISKCAQITFMSHIGKILHIIILNRLRYKMEQEVTANQATSRKKRYKNTLRQSLYCS